MSSSAERDRLHQAVLRHVAFSLGATVDALSPRERFLALALAVRDRMIERLLQTESRYRQTDAKRLYYLSMEFLIGRSLVNNLVNLGLLEPARAVLAELGVSLADLDECEAGRRPGQRRPRPAGRLLPRLAGHARHARLRLRHQLRIRPVSSGDPPRRADREGRQLAHLRHALGDRTRPGRRHRAAVRPRRTRRRPLRRLQPDVAGLEDRPRRPARHAHPRLRRPHRQLPSASSPPAPRRTSTWRSSTRATTSTPSSRRCCRKRSPKSSIRAPSSPPAASCGWCRSTSSPPAPSATSSAATSATTTTFDTLRRQGRRPAQRHPPDAGRSRN